MRDLDVQAVREDIAQHAAQAIRTRDSAYGLRRHGGIAFGVDEEQGHVTTVFRDADGETSAIEDTGNTPRTGLGNSAETTAVIVGQSDCAFTLTEVRLPGHRRRLRLVTTIEEWCENVGVPFRKTDVGDVREAWTGDRDASDAEMAHECTRYGLHPTDPSEVNAIALWHVAREEIELDQAAA